LRANSSTLEAIVPHEFEDIDKLPPGDQIRRALQAAREQGRQEALREISATPSRPVAARVGPPCAGMNCGCTDGRSHSPECHAEHAAAIAGGVFVKCTDAITDDDILSEMEGRAFHGDLRCYGVPNLNGVRVIEGVRALIDRALAAEARRG
jgi:hypothetical protein